jgi:uncharacterized membrane protein YgdD (TMEM256/DUF423 family)
MPAIVKFLGILMVALGAVFFAKTSLMRRYFQFWAVGKRVYLCAAIAFVLGVIMLIASNSCQWKGFVIVLGIIAILKTILIFILGGQKTKLILQGFSRKSVFKIRLMCFLNIAAGILLVYAV